MRLENFEIEKIKSSAQNIFGKDVHVTLFGSRVDDLAKGGDIAVLPHPFLSINFRVISR